MGHHIPHEQHVLVSHSAWVFAPGLEHSMRLQCIIRLRSAVGDDMSKLPQVPLAAVGLVQTPGQEPPMHIMLGSVMHVRPAAHAAPMVPVVSSKPPQLAPSRRVGVCMGLPPPPEKPPRDGRMSAEARNGRAADTKSFIIIFECGVDLKGDLRACWAS